MRYVEKYYRTKQAENDNMTHAHCILVTYGYDHITFTLCNTHSLSTTTVVARMLRYTYIACVVVTETVRLLRGTI
jgi:hypothetical protein